MADLTFGVDVECRSATCTEAQARGFTFSVDEPAEMGGTNTGPNPVEYIIGAFAGCLNVVGHMVANEMGFAIDGMKIHVEGDLDPAGFMGKDPNVRPGYKEIRVQFEVESEASEETLNEWMKVVETRCPVGDNLRNPTPISASLRKT